MPGKRSSNFAVTICSSHTNRKASLRCVAGYRHQLFDRIRNLDARKSPHPSAILQFDREIHAQARYVREGSTGIISKRRQYRKHGVLEKLIERRLVDSR